MRNDEASITCHPPAPPTCRERIGYKAPEEILFLEEMPLNPAGGAWGSP
jgi:hypothetical protein